MNYGQINATAAAYGVVNTNPMNDDVDAIRDRIDHGKPVDLTDKNLVKITRLRLIGDPGRNSFPYLDLSYCYGELRDGTPVRVNLPQRQFPKVATTRHIIAMFIKAKRYAKGMGALDAISIGI